MLHKGNNKNAPLKNIGQHGSVFFEEKHISRPRALYMVALH
jgi:hypothetical protein